MWHLAHDRASAARATSLGNRAFGRLLPGLALVRCASLPATKLITRVRQPRGSRAGDKGVKTRRSEARRRCHRYSPMTPSSAGRPRLARNHLSPPSRAHSLPRHHHHRRRSSSRPVSAEASVQLKASAEALSHLGCPLAPDRRRRQATCALAFASSFSSFDTSSHA